MLEYYQNTFDEFINEYERLHVNPWHNITKKEFKNICKELINKIEIDDEYKFNYFMNYNIKRLSGVDDVHTKFRMRTTILPFNYRIFNDEIVVNFPEGLRGSTLESINEVSVSKILKELDDIITYGTLERKRYELEKSLFDMSLLFSLPSLRESEELIFEFKTISGEIEKRTIYKRDAMTSDEQFDIEEYYYGDTGTYEIKDNTLIYRHCSVQNEYKSIIEESVNEIRSIDFNNISKNIIDLRGNIGGNSELNKLLIDFLSEHKDKKLVVLIDYIISSSGSLALYDLIKLGCVTVGEEIGTPFNSYGEQVWLDIGKYRFAVPTCYFIPSMNIKISDKYELSKLDSKIFEPVIFKPDYYVESTKEDFINNKDRVLEFALNTDL
ncbi:MAG: hypothetical protein SPI44_03160 [Bacilli bacterium]|nr:hypothetical protein [Bacilli bacterium]